MIVCRQSLLGLGSSAVLTALLISCSSGAAPSVQQTTTRSSAGVSTPSSTSPTPTVKPDEIAVRDAIMAFQDAYNAQDWDAYLALMCPALRDQFVGPGLDALKQRRAREGLARSTIGQVKLEGDTATVVMSSRHESDAKPRFRVVPMVRDDGWKVCSRYASAAPP